MKALVEQKSAGSNVYRACKRPPYVGQLRIKSWRYFIPPSGAHDPLWVTQAASYWQLQAETFGLRFHDDLTILVDYQLGIVTSALHVAEVLPGRREVDYKVPRVAAAAA